MGEAIKLYYFNGVNKYKSIFRAIKRGHATINGILIPRRPFNNRANTSDRTNAYSRSFNEEKKLIHQNLMKLNDKYIKDM